MFYVPQLKFHKREVSNLPFPLRKSGLYYPSGKQQKSEKAASIFLDERMGILVSSIHHVDGHGSLTS
jgi:hypothetical protein